MSPEELNCWKCRGKLAQVPLPYGRHAECPACRAQLHVCRMCRHFAPGKAKQCMEPMAEEVKEKTRSNFCDWFQPTVRTDTVASGKTDRSALDALFGDVAPAGEKAPDAHRKALDDLFGG